ncbi:coiled-coil domain-containing protein 149 [Hetaerina americana]|uniref:coiled-coil domain-containing protein 149 n=1 Tax=Hetaerina americana TaxID=62018 RepID=UPI003A7F1C5B
MNHSYAESCGRMDEYVDNFKAENGALRRKLQSKAEALLILSKELDQCRTERDQFKLMAEQLQDRCSTLKKRFHNKSSSSLALYSGGVESEHSGYSVAQILGETTEKNKALRIELEDVRQRLRDAQGDVKVLRMQLAHQRSTAVVESDPFPPHQREELVKQLETLNSKYSQLRQDLQVVLDEKEELVTERDAYKCKVHRLNFELNTLLKGDKKNIMDIDSLVMENRYLQDRLQQAEDDMKLTSQALAKYKSMLEKKRNKGTVKLGTNNSSGMLMTHRQVQQLVERGTSAQLPNTAATLSDMKSLCSALLEALNDKTLALSHQKKANRILASRISELESRLASLQGGSVVAFPSRHLLEGYAGSDVDREVGQLLAGMVLNSDGSCQRDWKKSGIYNGVAEYNEGKAMRPTGDVNDESRESSLPTSPGSSIGATEMVNGSDVQSPRRLDCGEVGETLDDELPPQLQVLVTRAMEEIRNQSVPSESESSMKGSKSVTK